jgi:hypothetical protein
VCGHAATLGDQSAQTAQRLVVAASQEEVGDGSVTVMEGEMRVEDIMMRRAP